MQEKEEYVLRKKDWKRGREDADRQPEMQMLLQLSVCLCESVRVCQREKNREKHLALPVLRVAILLANTPHPFCVLLSQDSDTQMLADASSQSS